MSPKEYVKEMMGRFYLGDTYVESATTWNTIKCQNALVEQYKNRLILQPAFHSPVSAVPSVIDHELQEGFQKKKCTKCRYQHKLSLQMI